MGTTTCKWCRCQVEEHLASLEGDHASFYDCLQAMRKVRDELIDELTKDVRLRISAEERYKVLERNSTE